MNERIDDSSPAPCSASVYDKTGRSILPGDTLKVYHFRAALRREHRYMYKHVTGYHESGKALVVDHLQPGSTPYLLLLDGKVKQDIEIVQGYAGVPGGCDFRDRKPNAPHQARAVASRPECGCSQSESTKGGEA